MTIQYTDIHQSSYSSDYRTLNKVSDTSQYLRISAKCEIIKDNCFSKLNSLISFTFEENPNLATIEAYSFYSCTNLIQINLSMCTKLTKISNHAFNSCPKCVELYLPKGLLEIGVNSFSGDQEISSIIIPASVNKIDNEAFTNCKKLENVTFEEGSNLAQLDSIFKFTAIKSFEIPQNCKKVDGDLFSDLTITNLTIHRDNHYLIIENNTVFSADKSTLFFFCNRSFQTYEIPNYVTILGRNSFYQSKLVTITILENVTTIDYYVFKNCNNLKNVTFLGSVYSFEIGVFDNCNNLELFIFNNSATITKSYLLISEYVKNANILFNYKVLFDKSAISRNVNVSISYLNEPNLIITPIALIMNSIQTEIYEYYGYNYNDVTIPKQVTKIRKNAFENSTIPKIDFEADSELSVIEDNAFLNCSKINTFDFTSTKLSYLGYSVFKDCSELAFVNFATTNFEVNDNLFENCNKLVNISNINNISDSCFLDCVNLTKVSIRDGSELIGIRSFENCYSLEIINIPSTVRIISEYAFINCKNLSSIIFESPNSLEKISINSFSECDSLRNISDFLSLKYICTYNTIYYINGSNISLIFHLRNSEDTFLSINCSVICSYSFNYSNNIENISIVSNSVSLIESFSFNKCQNLKHINFPMSIKTVQYLAFNECKNIQCPIIIEDISHKFINMLSQSGIPRRIIFSCVAIYESYDFRRVKSICNTSASLFWKYLSK